MDKKHDYLTEEFTYWSETVNNLVEIKIRKTDNLVTSINLEVDQPYPKETLKYSFSLEEINFLLEIFLEIKKEINK